MAEPLRNLGVQVEEARDINFSLIMTAMKSKIDIIHLHWLHPFFIRQGMAKSLGKMIKFICNLLIIKILGIKIVWTVHNIKAHDNNNLLLDRFCTTFVANIAHAIIVHCQAAECELVSVLGLKNTDKFFVVPHGNYIECYENKISFTEARKTLDIPNSNLVFLFLGEIRPYKGVLELIKIFKQLNHDAAHLVIAGKAGDNELTELIKQEALHYSNIKFIPGFVPDNEIQVYMNACDAVVFPYQDVLTSGAVLLAMSFSRPCIALNKGCIGETLDDLGAFLYNPDIEGDLLRAMSFAMQNHSSLSDMGKYNRQVVEKWNWNYVAEKTLQVYQSC
ncbi:glycosyltransferase family 4 protein [Chlorogloea sp. CCALA 695]|uniref:glycosyltransferase family 4 protein n=1 Tax=Chlorogloea sp. CCALA 695 TaxID=2107693 RepID=UPI0018EB2001|nr:glycosyltransferase family 4 protein [Chlorogloea sp. CCALA 695]